MKSSTYLRIVTAWWIAAIALIAFGALAKAQTPAGVINAPIYATGYISQVGGINVTTKIPRQPNHPTNLNIFTTEAITGTWSIQLPNPAFEGQIIGINCGASVTNISVNSSDGSSLDSSLPNSCAAYTGFSIQFDQRSNIWRNLGLTTSGSASDLSSGTLAATRGGAGTISGALKGNGSGVVSQAACADLSDGAAGCSTAIGTSGAVLPLLSTANTWSNPQTFTSYIISPYHLSYGTAPTPSSCGTSPSVEALSTSTAGSFTTGTGGPTSCTIGFNGNFPTAAFCTVTAANAAAVATTFYISSNDATGFVVTFGAAASSAKYQYTCFGR